MSPNTQTTYILEHHDQDDGSKTYEIWLYAPQPKYVICSLNDHSDAAERRVAKMNGWEKPLSSLDRARLITKALNAYNDLMKGKSNV